jgi:hypothetical protein
MPPPHLALSMEVAESFINHISRYKNTVAGRPIQIRTKLLQPPTK